MWDPWKEPRDSGDLTRRLKWFLLGRVAIISGFLGMLALSYLRSGEERFIVSVNRILLAIVVTYAFSILSAVLLQRIKDLRSYTRIQIAFDTALITGVIYLTGGIDSPFTFLYCLPIINSAVLLFGRGAMITALGATIAYSGLLLALISGLLSPSYPLPPVELDLRLAARLLSTTSTFFLIAYLSGILTGRLAQAELLLEEKQAERDHLAALQDTLAHTIGSGLVATDIEGCVTSVDETASELSGLPRADMVGTDIGTTFPALRLAQSARLRFLQSTMAVEPVEFMHQPNGHGPLHLRCTAAPLKDTYGHPIGALYVLQDVTSLKILEDQPEAGADVEALCKDDLEAAAEVVESADGLYGVSPTIRQLREMIERVAVSDATVLIAGESGTGKEVVARAIHAHSPRRDKPFVAINCGAIPEHLIESELFGHVRGAFTGAVVDRAGCFRGADGGSIFLDEIGDLPLHLQVKLLRVLQERVFRPVGSETSVAVNVRVLAASNRDLTAEVAAGGFREDLFYRLNVITIELPPLRERREDIPLLIRHFLRQFSDLHDRKVNRLSVGAGRVLLQHRFPGNVRELENIIEHAVALSDGDTATEEHLPPYLVNGNGSRTEPANEHVTSQQTRVWTAPPPPTSVSSSVDLERDLAEYEKAILLRALEQAGGVKKRAAELLGINYRSLRHRLQKYGLSEGGEEAA
jgi:two-component system response regulator PilR (NtrC family)